MYSINDVGETACLIIILNICGTPSVVTMLLIAFSSDKYKNLLAEDYCPTKNGNEELNKSVRKIILTLLYMYLFSTG